MGAAPADGTAPSQHPSAITRGSQAILRSTPADDPPGHMERMTAAPRPHACEGQAATGRRPSVHPRAQWGRGTRERTQMFDIKRKTIEWAGRTLTLETGRIARQADGAVLCTYGDTTVLATVVAAKTPKPGIDFFPLTVNYQEKTFAAGKIPGGYFKREGRPTEKETLVSRLIDRPIRPLFPDGYRHDTQVVVTVLSHDLENDPDILAMVATSAAGTNEIPAAASARRESQ